MTLPSAHTQFNIESTSKLITDVLDLLRIENVPDYASPNTSPTKPKGLNSQKILIPMMLCHSARCSDMEGVKVLLSEYDSLVNTGDYNGQVLSS